MALQHLGFTYSQNDVFNASGLEPMLARGCHAGDLAKAMMKLGFDPGTGWFTCPTNHLAATVSQQWAALLADLKAGIPSVVCMYSDDGADATEHFRLVVGFDPETVEVIFHEPAVDGGAYRRMPLGLFTKIWPLRTVTRDRCFIRFACHPKNIAKPPAAPRGFTSADFAQHMMALKKNVPEVADRFDIVIENPFVVIGDLPQTDLKIYAEKTVRWTVKMLKQDFFTNSPDEIIDIWLFKNSASYTNNTKMLVGRAPTTPYGFYEDEKHALIMNIKTGGGTLVHEIVHPFMHANFPSCPAWFNEGLASLYEQSGERNGHIVGGTNWRLRGLKDAIEEKRLPNFKALTATTEDEFYNADRGDNYAQARYLCYYLQEHGLLTKFYHAFENNSADDPTGYATLVATLGEKDMADFQKRFENYVATLHFP